MTKQDPTWKKQMNRGTNSHREEKPQKKIEEFTKENETPMMEDNLK